MFRLIVDTLGRPGISVRHRHLKSAADGMFSPVSSGIVPSERDESPLNPLEFGLLKVRSFGFDSKVTRLRPRNNLSAAKRSQPPQVFPAVDFSFSSTKSKGRLGVCAAYLQENFLNRQVSVNEIYRKDTRAGASKLFREPLPPRRSWIRGILSPCLGRCAPPPRWPENVQSGF